MIFHFGQMMVDKERGRLFSIQMDGSDSVPFIIKKDKLLIGRADSCEIRIYVVGVSPEHCIITFNEEGRGFVEPVNKCGLTFLNGELIERQVSLEHNDVITIVKRSFRFFYPSSSKFFVGASPIESSEENIVHEHLDFDPDDVFTRKGKEISEKRVTFGPRLSPEEFDKNMPPASPLRRGSLPGEKLKTRTSNVNSDVLKSHFKRNLFKNNPLPTDPVSHNEQFSAEPELPESSVVMENMNYENREATRDSVHHESNFAQSRPLFSDVVKKHAVEPPKNMTVEKNFNPKRLTKKTIKLKDSKRTFYKSPKRPVHPRMVAVGSTGHANSPETIFIYKKRLNSDPNKNLASSTKIRKSLRLKNDSLNTRKISEEVNFESSNSVAENILSPSSHSDPLSETEINKVSNSSPVMFHGKNINTPLYKACNELRISKQKSRKSACDNSDRKKYVDPSTRYSKESNASTRKSSEYTTPVGKRNHDNSLRIRSQNNTSVEENSEAHGLLQKSIQSKSPERKNRENEKHSSPLAAAIDNVAHIDEHTIDKSLKDIHNAVLALSCHSNVSPTINNESSADMCMNAVKKLALTISMVNAFHMYNRIIDDVSTFPLCFPSTSYDTSKSNMKCLQKSGTHQNEEGVDFARMAWFQDIMRNFFSTSICNDFSDGRRSIRSHERDLRSDVSSSTMYSPKSKKSKYASKGKVPLKAIGTGCKFTSQQSGCSQHDSPVWINDAGEMEHINNINDYGSCHECGAVIRSDCCQNSKRISMMNKELTLPEASSSHSLSSEKEYSYHSSSHIKNSYVYEPSIEDAHTETARISRRNSASKSIIDKNIEAVQDIIKGPIQNRNSVQHKRSLSRKVNKKLIKAPKILRKRNISGLSAYSRILRAKKLAPVEKKIKKVSSVTKKNVLTTSKRLKVHKKEKQHWKNLLKKVNYKITPQLNENVIDPNQQKISQLKTGQENLHKVKQRTSQKLLKKARSNKKSSLSTRISTNKISVSPKLLRKRTEKRKSVLFKSKGLRKNSEIYAKRKSSLSKDTVKKGFSSEVKFPTEKKTKGRLAKIIKDNQGESEVLVKTKSVNLRSPKNSTAALKSKIQRKSKRKNSVTSKEESANSAVMKRKIGRKKKSPLNKRNKNSTEVSENDLLITKRETRRYRRKVQEKFTVVDISSDEYLNSEVTAETKRQNKESSKKKNKNSVEVSENHLLGEKLKTGRSRRKVQEKFTLVDISGDEYLNSEVMAETKRKKKRCSLHDKNNSVKISRSDVLNPNVKTRRGKRKIHGKHTLISISSDECLNSEIIAETNSDQENCDMNIQQKETQTAPEILENRKSKFKTTKGKRKVKTAGNLNEDLLMNGINEKENSEITESIPKVDVALIPKKSTRNTKRKAAEIVENEHLKIAEIDKNKRKAQSTDDMISQNDNKVLLRSKRKKAEIYHVETVESERTQSTDKRGDIKQRRATKKSAALGVKLQTKVNSISEMSSPIKKERRKRILTAAEQEVASKQGSVQQKSGKRRRIGKISDPIKKSEYPQENESLEDEIDEKKKSKRPQKTPKKSKTVKNTRKKSNEAEMLPVQRVTRSLRSRK